MGKVAFVFSGQGAQAPGMGRSLYEGSPAARAVFDAADAIRPGTARQCFEGTEEELKETKNTQPCMFAMELAAAAALKEAGVRADMVSGFSLGELAALAYAGAADFDTLFRLTCLRGERMQQAAEARPTAMAAVVKLSAETVERLCAGFRQVYPVNYNCPGQISVSGAEEEMGAFAAAVKAAGGRAIPLKVRGAFHSPFMASAGEEFGKAVEASALTDPRVPVYADLTGEPYAPHRAKETLKAQMCSPVRWEDAVRHMIRDGADVFVELGPGKTLCGLIAKTDDTVRCFPVATMEEARALTREVNAC